MKRLLFLSIIFLCFVTWAQAENPHLYSTWNTMELDNCASAWLIKKFVDTDAEFRFYPKGEFIAEGIAFDTPDAKFRRTNNMSTFETILAEYNIKDPILRKIGKLIHEAEINYWAGMQSLQTKALNDQVMRIVDETKEPQMVLKNAFPIFDNLYKSLSQNASGPR